MLYQQLKNQPEAIKGVNYLMMPIVAARIICSTAGRYVDHRIN